MLTCEEHDQRPSPRSSRKQRGTYNKLTVDIVGLGEEEELLDLVVADSVVVRLASQAHKVSVHVDI